MARSKARRPNVLLIMSDQHRADCLDFATQANGRRVEVQTPQLRRLAASGVTFPRCYSESPVCVPARALLMTGKLPHTLDMYSNADVLPEDHATLAGCLATEGYFCQAIGKMHFRPVRTLHGMHRLWLSEEIPFRLEDDEFLQFLVDAGYGHVEEPHGIRHELYELPQVSQLPETHHTTAWTGRRTIDFLRQQARERPGEPFFCWTSFQKPHPPYEPPVPWHRLYRPEMAPAPQRSAAELAWLPGAVQGDVAQGHFPDIDRLAAMWSCYFGSISFIDSWIGMILDELEGLGLREDTVVVYTADHGEMMGDHWLLGKSRFYEQSAAVPGIISWPGGLPQGVVREQIAGLADIVPTLLDATGIDPAPQGLRPDGISLLPAARDGAPTRDVLIGQVGRGAQAQLMAVNEAWKYVYSAGENREHLFRPRGDGAEQSDYLAAGDAAAVETAAALRAELQGRYRQDGATAILDGTSPNGFRLYPARPLPQRVPTPSGTRPGNVQYARWIRHLSEGWTPPPARAEGMIDPSLPLRSRRDRYTWPPLLPL
ncbi:MAG: sulfatase-like hydrolase/transferase [Chloroflexota bacterium]|nr:sulfatase-like hydrolase/transferase [Chloroflexota bacterium]